jgi:hypothetical protein
LWSYFLVPGFGCGSAFTKGTDPVPGEPNKRGSGSRSGSEKLARVSIRYIIAESTLFVYINQPPLYNEKQKDYLFFTAL